MAASGCAGLPLSVALSVALISLPLPPCFHSPLNTLDELTSGSFSISSSHRALGLMPGMRPFMISPMHPCPRAHWCWYPLLPDSAQICLCKWWHMWPWYLPIQLPPGRLPCVLPNPDLHFLSSDSQSPPHPSLFSPVYSTPVIYFSLSAQTFVPLLFHVSLFVKVWFQSSKLCNP